MACCGRKSPTWTRDNPLVLGNPNNQPSRRIQALIWVGGMAAGQTLWATGTGLDGLLAEGYVREMPEG